MAEDAGEQIASALTDLFGSVTSRIGIRELWQKLGGRRGGTAALALRLGLPMAGKTERRSSMRRVQRYVTEAGQQRGAKLPRDIRDKLKVANLSLAFDRAEREGLVIVRLKGKLHVPSGKKKQDIRTRVPRLSGEPLDPEGTDAMLRAYRAMQTAPNTDLYDAASAELEQAFDEAQGADWGGYFGGHWTDFDSLVFDFGGGYEFSGDEDEDGEDDF